MGPSFAESLPTRHILAWLIGTLCATSIAFAALRPEPVRPAPSFERFDQQRPVKKCVDGRWVIAHQRQ